MHFLCVYVCMCVCVERICVNHKRRTPPQAKQTRNKTTPLNNRMRIIHENMSIQKYTENTHVAVDVVAANYKRFVTTT